MKVSMDQDLCVATGMCTGLAPEVFELDEEGNLSLLDITPGEHLRAEVEEAVRNCPVAAIRIDG